MNREADICSALIHNRKMRLLSAVADVVGISERECADQVVRLCADGILRRDRDYLLIANEPKAKAVASGVMPKVDNSAAEERVAARMAANAKSEAPPAAPKTRASSKPSAIPIPVNITVEKGVPIPPKRWGKVAAPNPFRQQFTTMAIGASFALPVPDGFEARDVAELLRKSASNFRRVMPGLRVTIRTEEGDKTVRLWRDPDQPGKEAPTPANTAARSSNGIRLPIGKRPGATARA